MSEHVRPDVLSAFVDGECGPAEEQWARDHLHGCADCRRIADDFAGVSRLVGSLPALQGPEEVRVAATVPSRSRVRRITRWAGAAAAAAVVGVTLGGLVAPAERTEPPVEAFMTHHIDVNHSSAVGQVLFAVQDR